jgi:hypothetical protein
MRNRELMYRHSVAKVALSCAVVATMWTATGTFCAAQTSSTNPPVLSPDLQEVVTLSHEQMGDEVITNYVKSTGKSYQLTADQIIYLKNQGVSSTVLSALIQTASMGGNPAPAPEQVVEAANPPPMTSKPAPPPSATTDAPSAAALNVVTPPLVPTPSAAPAPDVNLAYFQTQLAPFGTWVQVPGYGLCWYPNLAIAANPDWRPYYDMGHWVQTDNGLFWASDYTWGDIPFHYGRWIIQPGYGWLWVPDYTWGPAWVCWRQADADGCIGWAPLPVGAVFVGGAWTFGGVRIDVATCDFGLGVNFFVFVGCDHFHESFFRMRGHEWAYHVPPQRVHDFYRRSIIHNDFHRDEHGRFVNDGIGHQRMEQLTHNRIEQAHFQERNPVGDRDRMDRERVAAHQSQEVRNPSVPRSVDNRSEQRVGEEHSRQPAVEAHGEQRGVERGEQRGVERGEQHLPAADNRVYRPSLQSQRPGGGGSAQRQGQRVNAERGNH